MSFFSKIISYWLSYKMSKSFGENMLLINTVNVFGHQFFLVFSYQMYTYSQNHRSVISLFRTDYCKTVNLYMQSPDYIFIK